MKRLISKLPLLFFTATTLFAQSASPDDSTTTAASTPVEISDKAAAGIFAAIAGCWLICVIGGIVIWLWVAIWIMKDSARRQSPNRTLVVVLGWLVWPIGLIVHLVTRPKTIPGAPNP